jgi:uncharacterized protein
MSLPESSLYWVHIWHQRHAPKRHAFEYPLFMFWLRLDRLTESKVLGLGIESGGLYQFRNQDHLCDARYEQESLLQRVQAYMRDQGFTSPEGTQVGLLTNVRFLGYLFNPVSFYVAWHPQQGYLWALAQVENTFGEQKLFPLPLRDRSQSPEFGSVSVKEFYVSPFGKLQESFQFWLRPPSQRLQVAVHTLSETSTPEKPQLRLSATLTGKRLPLSTLSLITSTLRWPFVTGQVILGIHWEALRLWFKRVPFTRKEAHPHWQTRVLKPHASLKHRFSSGTL